jgi:hypothetical protein
MKAKCIVLFSILYVFSTDGLAWFWTDWTDELEEDAWRYNCCVQLEYTHCYIDLDTLNRTNFICRQKHSAKECDEAYRQGTERGLKCKPSKRKLEERQRKMEEQERLRESMEVPHKFFDYFNNLK